MHRFFVESAHIDGQKIVMRDKDEVHHLKDVVRLVVGDTVEIFDEKHNQYCAQISALSPKEAVFAIRERKSACVSAGVSLTIACAIPKLTKMEDVIDKLTQLGVDRIIPMVTERVIVKLDKQKAEARRKRWEKVMCAALKQSRRSSMCVIDPVSDFDGVVCQKKKFDLALIPHLGEPRKSIKEVLSKGCPKTILVLIGPEGDFTEQEITMAKLAGFVPVTLGSAVLRVDTAAIAAASYILLHANS